MGKKEKNDVAREHPFQAVFLLDVTSSPFTPLTSETSLGLCPLANRTLLETTFEFFIRNDITELYLICQNNHEEIEKYVNSQDWHMKITILKMGPTLSLGDCLRELDKERVIRSDPFLLLSGYIVSNLILKTYIEKHKARKKKDSLAIMTMFLKQKPKTWGLQPVHSDLIIACNTNNQQMVLYDNNPNDSECTISTVCYNEHSSITFHADVVDCYLDLCSPEVLVTFSDNFDYVDLRKHFVHNEVHNYELGNHIFAEIIIDEYAATVQDPYTYHRIYTDMCQRWSYPVVPDQNFFERSVYTYGRNAIYKETNVVSARSTIVGANTILGLGTTVDEHSRIEGSCIGRNCRIGKNVLVVNSHLWENVTIEDNVTIRDSILANGVIVHQGANIERGCILSFNVVIGEGCIVPEFEKRTTMKKQEIDTIEKQEINGGLEMDTVGSYGRIWELEEEENFLDIDDASDDEEIKVKRIRQTLMGCFELEKERNEMWTTFDNDSDEERDDDDEVFVQEAPEVGFHDIVLEMVTSGERLGQDINYIFVEIKGTKFSKDRTFSDCIAAIIPALLAMNNGEDKSLILATVLHKLNTWMPVLEACCISDKDRWCVVEAMEEFTLREINRESYIPLFRYLLHTVYESDLVPEEIILKWSSNTELVEDKEVATFIAWLQQEESDSE